jgi:hypothetical protein
MERAARTGAAFGSDDESDGGGDSAEDEDNDDENSEGRNAQGKRKGVNRSSVGGRGRISHNATHDEEEDEGNEADEVEDERAAAALASASTELAAAEEESRRNAKIQAKLKVNTWVQLVYILRIADFIDIFFKTSTLRTYFLVRWLLRTCCCICPHTCRLPGTNFWRNAPPTRRLARRPMPLPSVRKQQLLLPRLAWLLTDTLRRKLH